MHLPDHLLRSFREAYRESFDVDLPHDEAETESLRLLNFVGMVATIRASHYPQIESGRH